MATLEVLHFPDPRLRERARPVESLDESVRRLAGDMSETMYAAPGIGLAAIQVGVPLRVVVIDISETKDQPLCLINLEILERRGDSEGEEGCLSVPGIYDRVSRAEWIRFRALDLAGQVFERETGGLLAVCVQHELDHLEGKLFVDYLSSFKRQRIRMRLEKERKERRESRTRAISQDRSRAL
ncbi:MAG: peptide deformylase [Pseudomonadota bacterium]